MKIVILDGYTLNPGDLDWAPLRELGSCLIHEQTDPDQIIERAAGADVVLTNKTPLNFETISALPELKYIGVLASGVNIVDLEAAQKHNIVVTNTPGYGANSVAQMTFALLLELVHQVGHHALLAQNGTWSRSPYFSLYDRPLTELAGKTLGIVGYGKIGRQVARIARAFDMRTLVNTTHPEKYRGEEGIELLDIDNLFSESDIISLNCPLTDETEHLVNTARLARVKQGALLINTGRGQLVDETEIVEALEEGYLGGYATDVLSLEPPEEDNPLFTAPNCIVTPHIAWATKEARQRLLNIAVSNLVAYQEGALKNKVA
jgi:glycerate dehydrogenase